MSPSSATSLHSHNLPDEPADFLSELGYVTQAHRHQPSVAPCHLPRARRGHGPGGPGLDHGCPSGVQGHPSGWGLCWWAAPPLRALEMAGLRPGSCPPPRAARGHNTHVGIWLINTQEQAPSPDSGSVNCRTVCVSGLQVLSLKLHAEYLSWKPRAFITTWIVVHF